MRVVYDCQKPEVGSERKRSSRMSSIQQKINCPLLSFVWIASFLLTSLLAGRGARSIILRRHVFWHVRGLDVGALKCRCDEVLIPYFGGSSLHVVRAPYRH